LLMKKKIERKKCLGCTTLIIKGLGQKGERKKKKVRHKTISESIHHGEFIRRVARTNLEQYA
jgi:ribosomal protein S6E (S10)